MYIKLLLFIVLINVQFLQSQAELDEFEIRMEALQDEIQVQRELRNDEIEVATVSEAEKIKFKIALEERQTEMKDMQKKLEMAEEEVRRYIYCPLVIYVLYFLSQKFIFL